MADNDGALFTLYASLRAQALARHCALGRYHRADLFSSAVNFLGDRPRTPGIVGCAGANSWPRLEVSAIATEVDRWRIAQRFRENPLMVTSLRLVQLAVEHRVGVPGALGVIERILASLALLYRFEGDFAGYPLRYDAGTSDEWDVEIDADGREVPRRCCRFLTNREPRSYLEAPYDYAPRLDDPRLLALGESRFDLRHAEPSVDEIVGLVAAYTTIHGMVRDTPGAQAARVLAENRRQADNLGSYLAEHGYLLVRPTGNFTRTGGSGVNPALEYVIDPALSAITGGSYRSRPDFWGVMVKAGVAPCLARHARAIGRDSDALAAAIGALLGRPSGPLPAPLLGKIIGVVGAALLQTIGPGVVEALIDGARELHLDGSWVVDRLLDAKQALDAQACFDVHSGGDRAEFAQACLLMALPRLARFELFMKMTGGWSERFKPVLALAAANHPDLDYAAKVASEYLDWYEPVAGALASEIGDAGEDTGVVLARETNSLSVGVAALLGSDAAERQLAAVLQSDHRTLTTLHQCRLTLKKGDSGAEENLDRGANIAGGFMLGTALAWWLALRRSQQGLPAIAALPSLPTATVTWPPVTIPRQVIDAVQRHELVLPLHALRSGGVPAAPAPVNLYEAPPARPRNPNLLLTHRAPGIVCQPRIVHSLVLASDDHVWHAQDVQAGRGRGPYTLIQGPATARFQATLDGSGALHLLALGFDGTLQHSAWANGRWSAWSALGDKCLALAATPGGQGGLELFCSTRQGTFRRRLLQRWSRWLRVGAEMAELRATVDAEQRVHLFGLADQRLWMAWQQPGPKRHWHGWVQLEGTRRATRLGVTRDARDAIVVGCLDGEGKAFVIRQTTPGAQWSASASNWSPAEELAEAALRELALTVDPRGEPVLAGIGDDGVVRAAGVRQALGQRGVRRTGWSSWATLPAGGPQGGAARLTAVALPRGEVAVEVIDLDGALWSSQHVEGQTRGGAPRFGAWTRVLGG